MLKLQQTAGAARIGTEQVRSCHPFESDRLGHVITAAQAEMRCSTQSKVRECIPGPNGKPPNQAYLHASVCISVTSDIHRHTCACISFLEIFS